MKRMLQIVSGCLMFFYFMGNDVNAQDIEGLEIYSTVTKDQIIKKLGAPDKYEIQRCPDGMYEKSEYFRYDVNVTNSSMDELVIDIDDDMITRFVIDNSKYRAFTSLVTEGIRVGDSFSVIKGLLTFEETESNDGNKCYRAAYSKYWNTVMIYVKEDKITKIVCIGGEG